MQKGERLASSLGSGAAGARTSKAEGWGREQERGWPGRGGGRLEDARQQL